jgi:hypothetical protein
MKKKRQEKEEPKQLGLGIKEPFKNRFFKIKRSIDSAVLKFEVRKFLKDPLIWAVLVVSTVLIAQQIYLIVINLERLPTYIPLFRHFISIPRKLSRKDHIILFPTISTVSLLLSLVFTSRYYNSEKELIKILLFTSLLCTVSQSLILIDLIKLF